MDLNIGDVLVELPQVNFLFESMISQQLDISTRKGSSL